MTAVAWVAVAWLWFWGGLGYVLVAAKIDAFDLSRGRAHVAVVVGIFMLAWWVAVPVYLLRLFARRRRGM